MYNIIMIIDIRCLVTFIMYRFGQKDREQDK